MNSFRVRHLLLSPLTTRVRPWFQIDYRMRGCALQPCSQGNNIVDEIDEMYDGYIVDGKEMMVAARDTDVTFAQQVWVVPVNDRPVISDPQEGYLAGCITRTPCVDNAYSVFQNTGPDYYFGQYWRWEGTSDPMMMTGFGIKDADIDEGCIFDPLKPCRSIQDPGKAYRCGKFDFNARVLIGSITLNTIDDLAFYEDSRSAKGFTAEDRFLSQAIRSITYRVDSPENVASGQSLVANVNVANVNTQYRGAAEEYLYLRLSDQGLTGANGLAEVALDKNGNEGLRVDITIAAVNDAPTLVTPSDFTALEDVPLLLKGLDGNDADSDEEINSNLALLDWLSIRHNTFYKNRLRITAELKGFGNDKGRGLLYLNSDARDLYVVANGSQVYISIRSNYISNYACVAEETIYRPGKYMCGQGSVPSKAGKPCRGSWDFHTCSAMARGKTQMGTSNTSILLAAHITHLDPVLAHELKHFNPRTLISPISGSRMPSRGWQPRLRLVITDGESRGLSGYVDDWNATEVRVELSQAAPWSNDFKARSTPPYNSSWVMLVEPQIGQCTYQGQDLQQLCAQETTPELSKLWLSKCPEGEEDNCKCLLSNTCGAEGQYRLHLNMTKPAHTEYIAELVEALDNLNKTCGALPMRPLPFTSSLSKRCTDDSDCLEVSFERCIPGQTCKCCGNLTFTCSVDADCSAFGNPFERDQFCGCTLGYAAPAGDSIFHVTDRVCCADVDEYCASDSDCQAILEGSKCGCAKYYPICGPYTKSGIASVDMQVGYGQPCTHRLPGEEFKKCSSTLYGFEGTKDARILDQLIFYPKSFENNEMAGRGSTRIEFYAEKLLAILALGGLRYLTYNPYYPFYNRLYRLPVEERDPTTFKIDANDFDVLHVTANDMGNSGGGYRDIKTVTKSLPIVVLAVNNKPKLSGPPRINDIYEDVPYNIINNPAANKYGINVTDPDQSNFGFNDPRLVFGESLGFMVNLTVTHGCLFVNEEFLRFGPEYANRATNKAVLGGPDCALDKSFDIGGCTIRLKDYGQDKDGLHAVRCTDPQCKATEIAPCYSDTTPGKDPHCYGGRACTKMLALEGRFPDINRLLSNVTYLSDKDFNTGYGYTEQLVVEVSDNGIIGDPPIITYTDRLVIPITVLPINDPPVIGRLQNAECVDLKTDGSVNLVEVKDDERLFAINPSLDRIDVNEDTEFTIMPDRLWIADVDAEEAELRSSNVNPRCAGQCGSVVADPTVGCCIAEFCPELCTKMKLVSERGLPSEVLVALEVRVGKISFFPPPTRQLIRGITFMTNLSVADIRAPKPAIEPCANQIECAKNQSKIWIRARLPKLQLAMRQGFLRYVGKQDWAGNDMLTAWVSDDGYTDIGLQAPLTDETKLPIGVVAINDDPSILFPGGEGCKCDTSIGKCACSSVPPLGYTKGVYCKNDWMKYGFSDPWPLGRALECKEANLSSIPNIQPRYAAYPALSNNIIFDDVDMNETPFGNITVNIKIGRKNAGAFTINDIFSTVGLYQWVDMDEMLNLQVRGKMRDINALMERIFFDATDDYSGPAPFQIVAVDNNNFGICTPKFGQSPYKCNRAFCQNIFGSSLENKFVCGKAVGADNSVINFLPGGLIACSDVRSRPDQCLPGCRGEPKQRDAVLCEGVTSKCARIKVREGSDWSGPWSCLGCGYYNLATRQVEGVDESNPSIPGLTRATVDVLVGGAAACKFSNCTTCNGASQFAARPHGDGCGWCPSFCGGAGKCMIEKGGSALFETCSTDPSLPFPGNLAYRQCRQPPSQLLVIIGVTAAVFLIIVYFVYSMVRWLQRRHGSLVVFLKKKRFDITYHGRKLYLIPPEGANYVLFFALVIAVLIAGLMLSGVLIAPSGPFHFQEEIYLDSLTSMTFDLDNCNVRFMPTRNYKAPTSKIDAVKIRFAFFRHPDIVLENEACDPGVRFILNNKRNPAEKYTNFYCNVEILIPDRFVVPTTTINAIGNNLTTVRSGPMDEDTRFFGLEFGANEFIMTGERMTARLDNVTAKHLKYDVMHGSLLATNVSYTPFATFNSMTADMSVTTSGMTTAHFWQKSANLMCLTAATLFVDSSCNEVCEYVPMQDSGDDGPAAQTETDFRLFDRYYRRRNLLSVCKEIPNVPDCVTEACTLIETPQCLCKPSCDMVAPEDLDFNGFKGVEGKCNDEGKCCRILCGGYSRADLFPYPNTVRCGTCVPATQCSMPQCGQWSDGKLEQQWWFTSASGQMSLAALDHSVQIYNPDSVKYDFATEAANPSAFHSYKGNFPEKNPMSSIALDFNYGDKLALDVMFHPGGAQAPTVDWFWLRAAGPGAPPRSLGTLLWISSVRFLVLPDYFLEVVSNGFLNPKKAAGKTRLRPGFCPPVLKEGDPLIPKRIIAIQQLFSRTLQFFPPELPANPFPFGSLIAWVPLAELPSQFVLDPATNQLGFSKINPWTGNGPILYLIVLLSVFLPAVLASLLLYSTVKGLTAFLTELRAKKIRRENTLLNIYEETRIEKMNYYQKEEKLELAPEVFQEMDARTSFFYVVDYSVGLVDTQNSIFVEMSLILLHLGLLAGPVLYIHYVSTSWEAGFKAYHCENAVAQGKCYGKPEPISNLLNLGVLFLTLVYVAELSRYYLRLPYALPARILRQVFYGTFGFFVWIALWMLLLNATWIFLGVLQKPTLLAPYAVSAVCMVAVGATYYGKLMRFRIRVAHQVSKRIVIFASKLGDKFPKRLIEGVLDGHTEVALAENGLSHAAVVLSVIALMLMVIVLHAFIFVGFQVRPLDLL